MGDSLVPGYTEGFLDEVLYAPIAEMGKEGDSGKCLERINKLCGQMGENEMDIKYDF